MSNTKWTNWRLTFSLIPRCSVTGKFIIGWIQKRSRPEFAHSDGIRTAGRTYHQYITKKEYFKRQLKGK